MNSIIGLVQKSVSYYSHLSSPLYIHTEEALLKSDICSKSP